MTESQLWDYFVRNKNAQSKPFDRDFLWVSVTDFEAVKKYFLKEINIIHKGESYRSHAYFWHIHAVYQNDCVWIHKDLGNVRKFLPLGILHFFFDVIPYLLFAAFKRVPLKSVFEHPNQS